MLSRLFEKLRGETVPALSIEDVLLAEVEAIHGAAVEAASEEKPRRAPGGSAESERSRMDSDMRGLEEPLEDIERRLAFYRSLNKLNRAALCLSGGGIRSATFCLGVIQSLAAHKETGRAKSAEESLLKRFHYLSTVSGGGYIGSWLSAWRKRDGFATVWANLTGRPAGPDVEPPQLSWLRAYSNYLTPRVGIGSADSWTGAAIFLRNLLLNWLIIIPAIALLLLGFKILTTVFVAVERVADAWWPLLLIALGGVALFIMGQAFTTQNRPTRRKLDDTHEAAGANSVNQATFLRQGLLSSILSAILMASFLTSHVGVQLVGGASIYTPIILGGALGILIFAGGWLAGNPLEWEAKDLALWAASGSIYGGLLGLGAHLFSLLSPYSGNDHQSIWVILDAVIFGVPWILVAQLLAETVFVGLTSYEKNSGADREWLGRGAGWLAASAIVWALVTFLTFAAGDALIEATSSIGAYVTTVGGGLAGVVGALIGKSAMTFAKPGKRDEDHGPMSLMMAIGLAIAGPIFAAALVVSISVALDLMLFDGSLVQKLTDRSFSTLYILTWLVIAAILAAFVAAVASRNVNINRFSLHALYRNRLIRAYLGASRDNRNPDRFTGFDENDNLPVSKLWPPEPAGPGSASSCLFHIVNITLNVVQSKRLAWQERRAESFTVSPLHSGAAYKGFRPSSEYGHVGQGISLGTAMAISGAAASPNMGYHSAPSITLLLALFNVRLGWWLGNPGEEGDATYQDEGPATAIAPLLQETFGLTTDDKPYVYLSDGGHFENLGLYEMVRRRCRFIVVVDAGCDPHFAFEDLGNALRKIYIDLGIRIRFDDLPAITKKKRPADQAGELRKSIPYCAIGTVDYAAADGTEEGCDNGCILYVKPAYHGTEGAGIRSYAAAHPTFPHETTSDQFFTESQFESYRSLGMDIMDSILEGREKVAGGAALKKAREGLA
jgi:Patatin-like phospholipase